MFGEGPTRDVQQKLAEYRKGLRGPRRPSREHMQRSLMLLGIEQRWEAWSNGNMLRLLTSRIGEVFGGRKKKSEVVALIEYLRQRRGAVKNQIRDLNIHPSYYRDVTSTRPVTAQDDAALERLKPRAFNRTSKKSDNPWIKYYTSHIKQAKSFHPNMSHTDVMRLLGDAYTGNTRVVLGKKGRLQPKSGESTVRGRVAKKKQVKARKKVVKKENEAFQNLQAEISNPVVPTEKQRKKETKKVLSALDQRQLELLGPEEFEREKEQERQQLERQNATPALQPRRRFKGAYGEGWRD